MLRSGEPLTLRNVPVPESDPKEALPVYETRGSSGKVLLNTQFAAALPDVVDWKSIRWLLLRLTMMKVPVKPLLSPLSCRPEVALPSVSMVPLPDSGPASRRLSLIIRLLYPAWTMTVL